MKYLKAIIAILFIILILFFRSIENKKPEAPEKRSQAYYWTGKGDFSDSWDSFLLEAMIDAKSILEASDWVEFCPKMGTLTLVDKQKVVIQLISAIAYFESGFKISDRMKEAMGLDPVTKLPVYSEGLMQLSYQDTKNYMGKLPNQYCKFNWDLDKSLDPKDSKKTILDPKANLQCGLMILDYQVKKHKLIGYEKSYWSTLRPNKKLPEIKKIVREFPICN